jgi:hypothetical protein
MNSAGIANLFEVFNCTQSLRIRALRQIDGQYHPSPNQIERTAGEQRTVITRFIRPARLCFF